MLQKRGEVCCGFGDYEHDLIAFPPSWVSMVKGPFASCDPFGCHYRAKCETVATFAPKLLIEMQSTAESQSMVCVRGPPSRGLSRGDASVSIAGFSIVASISCGVMEALFSSIHTCLRWPKS